MPRYFIAILPPTNIKGEIIEIQRELEKEYGAVHAQKTPPHITVIPPFEIEEEKMMIFKSALREYMKKENFPPRTIKLDDFQRFESRTLFIDVAKNTHLEQYCKKIKLFFLQQKMIPQRIDKHFFVPHITIANKDLKKREFRLAWEEYKNRNYKREIELKVLTVLKFNGIKWEVEEEIY